MQGARLIATTGRGDEVCRLIINTSGDDVSVRTDGPGCLFLHGASCPGFEGVYRRVGRTTAPRAEAPRTGGWKIAEEGRTVSAYVHNVAGSAQLTLGCAGPAGQRFLSLVMNGVPRGWRAGGINDFVTATIGQERFELMFEGSHDHAAVSLRGATGFRLSPAFIAALQQGPSLTMSGRQVANTQERERIFPLTNGAILARVAQACR